MYVDRKYNSVIFHHLKSLKHRQAIRERGKNYGVILVPEGILTFVSEISGLLHDLQNDTLKPWQRELMKSLPSYIVEEFKLERESHGSLQLSQIESEKLLRHLVAQELKKKRERRVSRYIQIPYTLSWISSTMWLPTPFDIAYGETLGRAACRLMFENTQKGAYVVGVRNLRKPTSEWRHMPCLYTYL